MNTVKNVIDTANFSPIIQASEQNLRKGALQRFFTVLTLTAHKGEKLTTLEAAKIHGWEEDTAPSRRSNNKLIRSMGEKAKSRLAESAAIVEVLPHLRPSFKTSLTALYTAVNGGSDVDTFTSKVEEILADIAFFNDLIIETPSQLMAWLQKYVPVEETTDKTINTDNDSVDNKPKTEPLETSQNAAIEMAKDVLAAAAVRFDLQVEYAQAEQADSAVEAMAIITQAFTLKLEAMQADHDNALKQATAKQVAKPASKARTTAKSKVTNSAMSDAMEKATA